MIRELTGRAVAQPADVERALGTPSRGGIVTLHHSPELTILNIVWTPGMMIHPHEHRMWAVIGLYGGREDNTFYRRDAEGLVATGGRQLQDTETVLLGKSVIHSVTNPLRAFTTAIHVYGGDFFNTPRREWALDPFEERPFDMNGVHRVFAEANERWSRTAR